MDAGEVTVVIPSLWPEKHELSAKALSYCLPSLKKTFNGPAVVAYNGDGSGYPQGQCGAVNRIVEGVATDWILVSNNDMYYPPGWFERLSWAVDNFGLLVASPNLVEPDRGAQPFLEKFCGGLGGDFNEQCVLDFVETQKQNENRPLMEGNIIEDGFNLPFMVRRDVWNTVGGYDIQYDPWGSCSDTDLQTRFMLAGITPKRVRNSLVYHFKNASGTFAADLESYRHANWRHYEQKFGFKSPSAADGVWYRPNLPYEKLVFKPDWMNRYAAN